jgi:3-deoxy-7-phosphoheptulonate synthase
VHHHPDKALSDGAQSIYPYQFSSMMQDLRQIAAVLHRDVPHGIVLTRAAELSSAAR